MDFFDVVNNRFSYRGVFKEQPVLYDDKIKILQCATKAPSGCNLETTYFVAITNKEILNAISEIVPAVFTKTAPMIIAVLTENIITKCDVAFELEDYAAAVENLLLAVTACGYASVWLDGVIKPEQRQQKLRKLLNVKDNMVLRALLPVGVPAEAYPRKQKKSFEDRVSFID
ncbi:MAG: nitroreductase family protein [Clostridia bacterium]|nr:nitroreductase family protein [Clostridia bacterium]